jgi:hypothetical protein
MTNDRIFFRDVVIGRKFFVLTTAENGRTISQTVFIKTDDYRAIGEDGFSIELNGRLIVYPME